MRYIDMPTVDGLSPDEQAIYSLLVNTWRSKLNRNMERTEHYEGHLRIKDLGISIPPPILKRVKNTSVMWSKKAVDSLADCSNFDGFSFEDDGAVPFVLDDIVLGNSLQDLYQQSLTSELTHCCTFLTASKGDKGEAPAIISAYDAEHAAAIWDFRKKRIAYGLAIVDVDKKNRNVPTAVNLYTDTATLEIEKGPSGWTVNRVEHSQGRPLMEPMRNNPTLSRPFGQSRITRAIMSLEDEANREAVRMIMSAELYTAPTHWVMGADDDIFINGRWEAYLGSVFALPKDADGDTPSTGAYPQGSMEPHVSYMRHLANRLASEASIPVSSLLYTEANPSSADAIIAAESDLVKKAQQLNQSNQVALENIGKLSLAIATDTTINLLDDNLKTMKVRWKNPAHPSLVSQADAMQKLATAAPWIANSRVFWEQNGFSETDVDRLMSDQERYGAQETLAALAGKIGV